MIPHRRRLPGGGLQLVRACAKNYMLSRNPIPGRCDCEALRRLGRLGPIFSWAAANETASFVIRLGFTDFFETGVVSEAIFVGLLSQGTGIFGGLILLVRRENSFCVPVNRASSMLAGVLATWVLSVMFGAPPVSASELAGTGLVIVAIFVLAVPGIVEKRRRQARDQSIAAAR